MDLFADFFFFPPSGGVCVLTSGNSEHWPFPAVSQERATRQAVQRRTLCEPSDGHRRHAEYGKDRQGVQLGWHRTSLVEINKWDSGVNLSTASLDVNSISALWAVQYDGDYAVQRFLVGSQSKRQTSSTTSQPTTLLLSPETLTSWTTPSHKGLILL